MTWNHELLQAIFISHDLQIIQSMHLFSTEDDDKTVWKLSRDGKYSDKSAYYHAMEKIIDNFHYRVPNDWSLIWKLNIPLRIKLLL